MFNVYQLKVLEKKLSVLPGLVIVCLLAPSSLPTANILKKLEQLVTDGNEVEVEVKRKITSNIFVVKLMQNGNNLFP